MLTLDEELTFLDTTLCRIEIEIHSLLRQRARIRRRLNELRPPIHGIPPEVLAIIFGRACTGGIEAHMEPKSIKKKLTLSAVCRHWREVIWSTPWLWTYINSFTFPATRRAAIKLLDIHLSNSKSSLLQCRLFMGLGWRDTVVQMMTVLISRRPTTIQHLEVSPINASIWRLFLSRSADQQFLNMRSLDLSFTINHHLPTQSPLKSCLPKLRALTLGHPPTNIEHQLPFHQITTLHLINTCSAQAVLIMVHCPHLVDLCVSRALFDAFGGYEEVESLPGAQLEDTITFPSLQTLAWKYTKLSHAPTHPLSFVRLPSIRSLEWNISKHSHRLEALKPMFLSMTLVKCLKCNLNRNTIRILELLPSIETLNITGVTTFESLCNLFDRLSIKDIGRLNILPQLTKFEVRADELFNRSAGGPCVQALVALLESRRAADRLCAALQKMTISYNTTVSSMMPDWHISALQVLVEGGLELNIGVS